MCVVRCWRLFADVVNVARCQLLSAVVCCVLSEMRRGVLFVVCLLNAVVFECCLLCAVCRCVLCVICRVLLCDGDGVYVLNVVVRCWVLVVVCCLLFAVVC